jgi:hypothetical protein
MDDHDKPDALDEAYAKMPKHKRIAYLIWSNIGWYGWWQLISVIYTIGLGCAAIGDDLSTVIVPLLRWRALVLCGFVYSGVFALGWMLVVARMISREKFDNNWKSKVPSKESEGLVKNVIDPSAGQRAVRSTIWDRTAALTGVQLCYHTMMFLIYGMASTYIVFLYSYTDESGVLRIQDAIDKGYSKGAMFMTYAVHKKISMLVWLQLGMIFSVLCLLYTALLIRFSTHRDEIERLVHLYNLETFLAPIEDDDEDDATKTKAMKTTTVTKRRSKNESVNSQRSSSSLLDTGDVQVSVASRSASRASSHKNKDGH